MYISTVEYRTFTPNFQKYLRFQYIYVYIYIYLHTYIHTHTHTHRYIPVKVLLIKIPNHFQLINAKGTAIVCMYRHIDFLNMRVYLFDLQMALYRHIHI